MDITEKKLDRTAIKYRERILKETGFATWEDYLASKGQKLRARRTVSKKLPKAPKQAAIIDDIEFLNQAAVDYIMND